MTPLCSAGGCRRAAAAKGLCLMHYKRMKRHGIPSGGRAPTAEIHAFLDRAANCVEVGCLLWPYGRDNYGYGRVHIEGLSRRAHRVICERAHGSPPFDGAEAAHLCGQGHLGCVNPRHLRWATRTENLHDRVIHATDNRGTRHGQSKLHEDDVRLVRALAPSVGAAQIAKRLGVSRTAIYHILSGRSWAWLDAPSPKPDASNIPSQEEDQ